MRRETALKHSGKVMSTRFSILTNESLLDYDVVDSLRVNGGYKIGVTGTLSSFIGQL